MATLVLSTAGTLLGGPIGGAIGSLIGQSIDEQIFGPSREGPRLGDLSVQTSAYGTAIPKIFGTMRAAGSIIWSTDLAESSAVEGAKGQPETTTYSYSVSFAVALSSRPIASVGRIWADGKLIRTADGQFTIDTGFRICGGSEDQAADPLIASIESEHGAPAYRGIALAIFEDMQLAEFGNRIPFLTFEVVAEDAPVPVCEILADVSGGAIACEASQSLLGYAAHGSSIAKAIEPLVETFDIGLLDDGTRLVSPPNSSVSIADEELGCIAGAHDVPRIERSQLAASSLPTALLLGFYDPSRDYQSGVARASIDARATSVERIDLAGVLDGEAGKALAETSLARRWAQRDSMKLRLPPSHATLSPGSLVVPPGASGPWRAERVTIDSFAVIAELRPLYSAIASVPADAGRILASAPEPPGQTDIAIFELPADETGGADSPVVAVAASSDGKWRSVPLQVEAGPDLFFERTASLPALIGSVLTTLPSGQSALFDLVNSLDVEVARADDWLESRDDDALLGGANAAAVGNEVIQFGRADALGGGRFRLSRLLRGRRGTEWAMAGHQAGERLILLDPARVRLIRLSNNMVGASLRITPYGIADSGAQAVEAMVRGEAMRPPSPVRLNATMQSDGSIDCSWIRRSAQGWAWLDGVDSPLGCSSEVYRVALSGSTRFEIEVDACTAQFSAEQAASLGSGEVELSVVQVGDLAVSRPAIVQFTIQ